MPTAVAPSGDSAIPTQMQMHLNMHTYGDPSCVLSARAAGDARVINVGLRRAAEAATRGSPGAGLGAGRGVRAEEPS